MLTPFLNLPRELRDLIYNAVLLSPTGFIHPSPIPHSHSHADKSITSTATTTSTTTVNPRYKLHIINASIPNWKIEACEGTISLSLLRTCTQINREARHIFWAHNTFSFPSAGAAAESIKSIGQIPSRLIEQISFRLALHDHAFLRRALCLLESRTRYGAFRSLRIDLFGWELDEIWSGHHRKKVYAYEAILDSLRRDAIGCRFKRRLCVVLPKRDACALVRMSGKTSFVDETLRDLALASGGKIFANGVLLWEDYKMVERDG